MAQVRNCLRKIGDQEIFVEDYVDNNLYFGEEDDNKNNSDNEYLGDYNYQRYDEEFEDQEE